LLISVTNMFSELDHEGDDEYQTDIEQDTHLEHFNNTIDKNDSDINISDYNETDNNYGWEQCQESLTLE